MSVDEWASQAIAAMLERVMSVCVFEYELKLRREMRRG